MSCAVGFLGLGLERGVFGLGGSVGPTWVIELIVDGWVNRYTFAIITG